MVHCIGIWSLVQHFGGHASRAGVESGYKARKLEQRAVICIANETTES